MMADLEPRVRQVEEDVAILKGEVKSVLMEVRTALLSQSNPFAGSAAAGSSQATTPVFTVAADAAATHQPQPNPPAVREEARHDERAQQSNIPNNIPQNAPQYAPAQEPQQLYAPQQQQPVPLPVAQRHWELNTLAMLLAWCQGNMARLSNKEMTSLLSLARYGGLVDEELSGILLEISSSFDIGKEGRAASVSEYLLALHELHSVVKDEEEPAVPRLRRAS